MCPRSWKSNNLGFSAVDKALHNADAASIQRLLRFGVWSPLQQKYVKLWDSAINRLMYVNQHVDLYSIKTRKKVYERFLSPFGCEWLWYSFKMRVERTIQKMYERALFVRGNNELSKMFHFDLSTLFVRSDFKKQALWHCLLKQFDSSQLGIFAHSVKYDMDEFFNIETWKDVYLLKHDNANLSTYVLDTPLFPDIPTTSLDSSVFIPYVKFEDTYKRLSIYLARMNLSEYKRRGEQITRVKRKNGVYGYDEKLC